MPGASYAEALQIAHAIHLVRPFRGGGSGEIVSRLKCYAFDTGFVTFEKGWNRLREDDRGLLWEHLVLDSLRFRHLDDDIFYWRDKSGREVDFVVRRGEGRLDTLECKIDPDEARPGSVIAFRRRYPLGRDYIVVPVVKQGYGTCSGLQTDPMPGRVWFNCCFGGWGRHRGAAQGCEVSARRARCPRHAKSSPRSSEISDGARPSGTGL